MGHMAQVAVADIALYLYAVHVVAVIKEKSARSFRNRLRKTWPPRDGVVLGAGREKQAAAPGAGIVTGLIVFAVGVSVRRLRAAFPQDVKLRRGEQSAPFFFGVLHPSYWFWVAVFGIREHIYPTKHFLSRWFLTGKRGSGHFVLGEDT